MEATTRKSKKQVDLFMKNFGGVSSKGFDDHPKSKRKTKKDNGTKQMQMKFTK